MKAMIDSEGHLKIEVGSIIEALSEPDLRAFAKYAVFQEHLLRGVIDAMVTSNMWTDDAEAPWWFDSNTFNAMRMKLVALMPEITAQAVRHLECELRRAQADAKAWQDACWTLERDWPEGRPIRRNHDHLYVTPMTKEQASAFLATVEAKVGEVKTAEADVACKIADWLDRNNEDIGPTGEILLEAAGLIRDGAWRTL